MHFVGSLQVDLGLILGVSWSFVFQYELSFGWIEILGLLHIL
jgi:hypothetical protein